MKVLKLEVYIIPERILQEVIIGSKQKSLII